MHSPKPKKSNSGGTSTPNPSSSKNNEPLELCSPEMDYINDDGIVQPPGRKTSKGKRKMQCRDELVAGILAKFLVIMQQQCHHNQAELEMRTERALMMKKDYELHVQKLKMKIELKEKELASKKKVERRKLQHMIMNLDPSKIVPSGRGILEKMQERILKVWAEEYGVL